MIPGNFLLIENTLDVNIGTKDRPHILKIRKDMTSEEVTEYSELLKELQDILTWNYKDILGIDPKLVVYNLLLKANAKPIKQKLRCHWPEANTIVYKDIQKLLEVGLIKPIDYLEWLANGNVNHKEEWHGLVCIDLNYLNYVSPKDDYPPPSIDQLIDSMTGYEIMSLLDGFLGYN